MPLRPTLWSTIFTVPTFFVLLILGTWQLDRLAWKEAVAERLESRLSAQPIMLPTEPFDPEQFEFRRVRVAGEFLHESEFFLLSQVRDGVVGIHVVTPLRRLADASHILVDRGWLPLNRRDPAGRHDAQVASIVTLDAVVRRTPSRGWFVPENRPADNEWYFMEPAAMAAAAGVAAPGEFFLAAVEAASSGDYPVGRGAQIAIRNDHLGYAITWYALAAVLVAVYLAHGWKRRP